MFDSTIRIQKLPELAAVGHGGRWESIQISLAIICGGDGYFVFVHKVASSPRGDTWRRGSRTKDGEIAGIVQLPTVRCHNQHQAWVHGRVSEGLNLRGEEMNK